MELGVLTRVGFLTNNLMLVIGIKGGKTMFHKKLALLFIMTSLLTFASYPAEAQDQPLAIPTRGLVGYWTFDQIKNLKVEDVVGNNDAKLQKPTQNVVKGKFGNAMEFDGKDDFLALDPKKLPLGNSAISVSVWIFRAERGDGEDDIIWIGVNDCCNISFFVRAFTGVRRLNNQLRMGQFPNGELHGPEMELNKWHHIVAVYDGVKQNLLYLDGVEVATKELDFEPDIQPGPIAGKKGSGAVIGSDTTQSTMWSGLIDELGIYNVALTLAEVQRIFNANDLFAVEPLGKLSLTWAKIKASR